MVSTQPIDLFTTICEMCARSHVWSWNLQQCLPQYWSSQLWWIDHRFDGHFFRTLLWCLKSSNLQHIMIFKILSDAGTCPRYSTTKCKTCMVKNTRLSFTGSVSSLVFYEAIDHRFVESWLGILHLRALSLGFSTTALLGSDYTHRIWSLMSNLTIRIR